MTLLQVAKAAARRTFPTLYSNWAVWSKQTLKDRVPKILTSSVAPQTYPEEVFDRLQAKSQRVQPPWAPNHFTRWHDSFIRVAQVLQFPALYLRENLKVLDAACGNGMSGPAFSSYGHSVVLHDKEDWRDARAQGIDFVSGDLCQPLPVPDETFDLVCSWDSFEHIGNVNAAFEELVRLCRAGGYIYLDFGPLWCSPLGLHALNFNIPYAQFLFSADLVEAKMLQFPNVGGDVLEEDGAWANNNRHMDLMNKVRLAAYKAIWNDAGCEIAWVREFKETRHLHVIADYPQAFTGRGLTFDDVTTDRIAVLLRKP